MNTLRLRRLDDHAVTGWKRYRALDGKDPVGFVVEHHDWAGWRHGPPALVLRPQARRRAGGGLLVLAQAPPRTEATEALRAHLASHSVA